MTPTHLARTFVLFFLAAPVFGQSPPRPDDDVTTLVLQDPLQSATVASPAAGLLAVRPQTKQPPAAAKGLLPHDPNGHGLPAATAHATAQADAFLWAATPIERALDELARFRGVEIHYARTAAHQPVVTGDFRETGVHETLRAISGQAKLTMEFSNGVYTLSHGMTARPEAAQFVTMTTSRTFSVQPDMAAEFINCYLPIKSESGSLTFLGVETQGFNSYRVVDSPVVLERLGRSLDGMIAARQTAIAAAKPATKERTKLLKQRASLVEKYLRHR